MDAKQETRIKKMSTAQLVAKAKALSSSIEDPGEELKEAIARYATGTASRSELIEFVLTTSAAVEAGRTSIDRHFDPKLLAEIDALGLEYEQVEFPVMLIDGVFHFASGQALTFTEIGAGYLSERIKSVPYAKWTNALRESPEALYNLIKEHEDELGTRAYVVPTSNGAILSFMNSYNPYLHRQLLQDLCDCGLNAKLEAWRVYQTHVELFLNFSVIGNVTVGMRIKNGHSGHFAMSFHAYIKTKGGSWEYLMDVRKLLDSSVNRRRHLSKLDEVRTSLVDTYDALSKLNFLTLLEQPASLFIATTATMPYVSPRQEELLVLVADAIEAGEATDISDCVALLSPFSATRGYLSSVAGILDFALEELCKTFVWAV